MSEPKSCLQCKNYLNKPSGLFCQAPVLAQGKEPPYEPLFWAVLKCGKNLAFFERKKDGQS